MNKRAIWFGIKANLAAMFGYALILLPLYYLLLAFGVNLVELLTEKPLLGMLIFQALTALSFYLILGVILKNSQGSPNEYKISGIMYTLYIWIFSSFIFSPFNNDTSLSFLWPFINALISVGIVYSICRKKIQALGGQINLKRTILILIFTIIVSIIVTIGLLYVGRTIIYNETTPAQDVQVKEVQTEPQPDGWEKLVVDSQFAIEFPSKPKHESRRLGKNGFFDDLYSVYAGDVYFELNTFLFPSNYDTQNKEANKYRLQDDLAGLIIEGEENNVIVSSTIKEGDNGNVSLDYSIQYPSVKENIRGRFLITNQRFYRLMVGYTDDSYNEKNYLRFVNSFQPVLNK